MSNDFNGQDAGDETRRYGDYYYGEANAAIEAGQVVAVDGSNDNGVALISPADNNDHSAVLGIAYIDAEEGEQVTVKTNGGVLGLAQNGTEGDTVGLPDVSGSGETAGELSTNGDEYLIVATGADANGNDVAELSK